MNGQLTIWDYFKPEQTPFCWDDDINYLEKRLSDLATEYGYKNGKVSWSVWSHVPNYGYRLTHDIIVHKKNPREKDFINALDDLCKEALTRGIELDPMYNAVFYYKGNEARLSIYSTFKDKARRKIRR